MLTRPNISHTLILTTPLQIAHIHYKQASTLLYSDDPAPPFPTPLDVENVKIQENSDKKSGELET